MLDSCFEKTCLISHALSDSREYYQEENNLFFYPASPRDSVDNIHVEENENFTKNYLNDCVNYEESENGDYEKKFFPELYNKLEETSNIKNCNREVKKTDNTKEYIKIVENINTFLPLDSLKLNTLDKSEIQKKENKIKSVEDSGLIDTKDNSGNNVIEVENKTPIPSLLPSPKVSQTPNCFSVSTTTPTQSEIFNISPIELEKQNEIPFL